MFYYLNGTLVHTEPYLAVVDCGGVAYACATTSNTLASANVGKAIKLYTYLHVREDIFDLYGFASQAELKSFKMLIGVSGVGPKAALAILSAATPDALTMAIITGDEKMLTVAPGIGKKIAQRIILELKDKMSKETQTLPIASADMAAGGAASKTTEAAAALAVLGYSQQEIALAMKGLDADALSLEEIIRQSLKRMMK